MSNGRILVVEDDFDISNMLRIFFTGQGYNVEVASRGNDALDMCRKQLPDLIVLDIMLPDTSGTEVCRQLRADERMKNVPIVMMTARGEEIDRVVGFEVGADDYVVKPFSVRELVLRIRAILRRAPGPGEEVEDPTLESGPIRIDVSAHRVWVDGEELALTATEFKLLVTLVSRSGRVQSRGLLLQDVWEMPPDLNTRTVDTHIKRLREKLGVAAAHVQTVRGVGYRFNRSPTS